MGKRHAHHLLNALREDYEVTVNEKGDLYAGINLVWDYTMRTCRLSMEDYIELRAKFNHPNPKKPQHSPHCHTPVNYGAKVQYAKEAPDSPPLDDADKLHIPPREERPQSHTHNRAFPV